MPKYIKTPIPIAAIIENIIIVESLGFFNLNLITNNIPMIKINAKYIYLATSKYLVNKKIIENTIAVVVIGNP